jgi:hypothetical protein
MSLVPSLYTSPHCGERSLRLARCPFDRALHQQHDEPLRAFQ